MPGSEVAALIAATDWSASPLGDPLGWPPSLRTAVGICLSSRFPILLWWGPDLAMVYNDAYRPMLGESKHPRALGAPGREVWTEIWDVIGPMLEQVMSGRGATWSTDQLFVLERNGHPEECYFTFSYSPITTESGEVGGVFCAVTETTERVIGERRLATLADMASLMGAATRADAIRSARSILGANPDDHPAVVVLDAPADGDRAGLAEAVEQQLPRFGAAHPGAGQRPGAPGVGHGGAAQRGGRRRRPGRRGAGLARVPPGRAARSARRPRRRRRRARRVGAPARGTPPSSPTPPCA